MLSPAQGVSPQPAEVRDFSGGMTDNYIGGAANKYQLADNFYIGDDAKLVTRPALVVHDTAHPRVTSNKKINSLAEIQSQVFQVSAKGIYYNNSGFTHILGPTSNEAFSLSGDDGFYTWTRWNNHLLFGSAAYDHPVKLFKDGSTWKVHELGLPTPASVPTISATGSGKTFLYAFHYVYSYTANGVDHEEVGPVLLDPVTVNATNDPGTTPIGFTAIPVLANSTTRNWDTANIKLKIFRTTDGGDVFYAAGEVANGVTTFSDTTSDADLQLVGDSLYITGGTLEHEAPPQAKCVHQVAGVTYYANIKVDGVELPTHFRLSNVNKPWSVPTDFEDELDEEIFAVSSFGGCPLFFCRNKIYRVEGKFLPDGSGDISKRVISETAGCLNQQSVVQTEYGIFWAGQDGFYYTDGNQVTRVSEDINKTYRTLVQNQNQKDRISGAYYPKKQWVLWAVQADDVGDAPDTSFVLHLKAGVSASMPFTTWTGGSVYPTNYAPTSLLALNGVLYHADVRGYLMYYDDEVLSDAKIDSTLAVTSWSQTAIMYDHLTIATDFGTDTMRKWVSLFSMVADNMSSVSLRVSSNNDNSGEFRPLAIIKYKGSIAWGDYDISWGDPIAWNYAPLIKAKRSFTKPGLRCMYKQLRFQNAFALIEDSDGIPSQLTVVASAKTATLVVPALIWPPDILDYYLLLSVDGYQKQYRIISKTSTVLTLEDISGGLTDGTYDWEIFGYRRDEVLKLHSYAVTYDMTSATLDHPGVNDR